MTEAMPRYPIFERVPKKNESGVIILIIIMVVMAIVIAIIVYVIFRPGTGTVVNRCEPGLCVITLATGVKTCPSDNTTQLAYNTVFQDCTSANYCQSARALCGALAGGILNCDGACGVGNNQCNCQAAPT